MKKIIALFLVLAMALSLAACSSAPKEEPVAQQESVAEPVAEPELAPEPVEEPVEEVKDTLVVGYDDFSAKFSPFFAKTQYDMDVSDMTQAYLMLGDREGTPVQKGIEGQVIPYNGTDYTYTGIGDVDVTENADGTIDYAVKIRDDIKFSDGEPMTIDDVIFSMYVECDPAYDGNATLYECPIIGMEEYRSGMDFLYKLILNAGKENEDFSNWTQEQQEEYWAAFEEAGAEFAQEIIDYCIAEGYGTGVADSAAAWGYELDEGATAADFFAAFVDAYGYDLSDNGINAETAGSAIEDLIDAKLGEDAAVFNGMCKTGDSATSIAGIERIDDYNLVVHCSSFDAPTIYQFEIAVAPLHYYGNKELYDYDNNMFGFTKGDMTLMKSKTTQPMGAGPYKFISYENGVVTFEANETYYKGEPKIKYMLFQETNDSDKVSGVAAGTFDLTDPSFNNTAVEAIKEYNGGELTGPVITTNTVDNLGYGYIGFCANNVKVGNDSSSTESKNLRKALATVMAAYRDTSINSYYGERASVIQYPISNTSWAAPKPNDEGYQQAFSVDVDGNPIYTDDMSEEQKYEAALNAAVGFLKAAGFTWDEAEGKFTEAPEGAKLVYEAIIPGDGIGDHPSYGILTATKEALATIGITLDINDPSDSNVLWNAIEAVPATAEIWAAAWQATVDPDMTQVYSSGNINGAGGTDSNHYYVTDAKLDELIREARTSADMSFRKATYKDCLDIIIDWAVELPVYQRQNAIIFSTERLNLDTVTPDITTFWQWQRDIENLELKAD